MKNIRTPYGNCTGCRRGSEGTHQEGTVEHPLQEKCLRSWPGARCYGVLQPHAKIKKVRQCDVCGSLYTDRVLKDLKK